jgi:hypothetical protein
VAGRLHRLPERAAAGALGAWWLLLADHLAGHPRAQEAASRALLGLEPGTLLLIAIWAVAAAVLPWIVRGRYLALDLVTGTAWAAGLASATGTLYTWLDRPEPAGLVAGAIAAGVIAVSTPRYSSAHECAQEP